MSKQATPREAVDRATREHRTLNAAAQQLRITPGALRRLCRTWNIPLPEQRRDAAKRARAAEAGQIRPRAHA